MNRKWGINAGWIGAVVMSIGLIIVALAYHGAAGESYSPFNHFVSELGDTHISTLWIGFSVVVIIGGLAFVLLINAAAPLIDGTMRRVIAIVGTLTGIMGALVGLFPMDVVLTIHSYLAFGFFVGALVTVGAFMVYLLLAAQSAYPKWMLIPSALPVICLLVFLVRLFQIIATQGADQALGAPAAQRAAFELLPASEWGVIIFLNVWVIVMALYLRSRSAEST